MNSLKNMEKKSNIIIYTTEDGLTKIETTFDKGDFITMKVKYEGRLKRKLLAIKTDIFVADANAEK